MAKKIVIIEDNKDLVQFIKDFLAEAGDFEVIGFTQGTDALKKLPNINADLILINLELEDIRGETICVEIRKEDKDIPIIIITGDKSQESIINCLNSGADDYITKPFNAEVLLARIHARLRAIDGIVSKKLTA